MRSSEILRYEGNSGAPKVNLCGALRSGETGGPIGILRAGIMGGYSDMATGFAFSPSYEPVSGTPDVSNSVGIKSEEQLKFEDRRSRLIGAVTDMKIAAPNWSGEISSVQEASADGAVQFLRLLPGDAILPRVAPDGEGDVMFVWEGQNGNCIVTVEKRSLHLVSEPGAANVQHVGPLQFLGFSIPPAILAHIPRK